MNIPNFRSATIAALVLAAGSATALGQWSTNPAANLTIADLGGEQVQPKIRATGDGGCYVSWFDNSTGGYDVYLQRLDAAGVEQWAHNGILIADRGVSSTVDYDMIVDANGNAVITYNDDSASPGGAQQISVQRVSPAGAKLWGATGVSITNSADFKANPHVVALSDGTYVVGYSSGSPQSWTMQKLDAAGSPLWTAPGINVAEAGHYLALSDFQPAGVGGFIALWVRASGTNPNTSSKALYSQKYDASGAPQWNTGNPLIVFNSTSIQNGYFPTFLPDGSGGAVYGWYEIGGSRNAYIQHVLSDGSLKFAAPIANTGATPGRGRFGAGLAYNPPTGEYYLASSDGSTATSSADGAIVQKFDSAGTRLWGDSGVVIVPAAAANSTAFVQCQVMGDGCAVFGINPGSASASGQVFGARVIGAGTVAWSNFPSAAPNVKSRLATAMSSNGFAMLAWGNGATGSADIQVQNVNPDGTFGPQAALCYPNCDGSSVAPILNVNDFICFQQKFAGGDSYANCDASTVAPVLNINDFICFQQKFAAGCR